MWPNPKKNPNPCLTLYVYNVNIGSDLFGLLY
jgi:hypothetical protein